jgi:hypothetical protein
MTKIKLPSLPVCTHGYGIPSILHRIWVGGPVPAWVQASWRRQEQALSKSAHPWDLWVYTDETLPTLPGIFHHVSEVADAYKLPPRGKADLLRVAAVGLYGGLYLDADVVILRSLDDLFHNPKVETWTTSHSESYDQQVLWNGGFAAAPHSDYMAEIMAFAQRKLERGVTNEHFLAGPRAYRTFLPTGPTSITEWNFQFEATAAERRIMAAGGEFDLVDMRRAYPARLKHVGPRED